jgi:hypothetical protein
MSGADSTASLAVKDESAAHPIAAAWRPVVREIVRAFVRGDYGLAQMVRGVEAIPLLTAEQIRAYVADYGATLVELPPDTWETSCAQWMGTHWDVLVDLWTKEEGRSDLVLSLRVVESGGEPRFAVQLVYVP